MNLGEPDTGGLQKIRIGYQLDILFRQILQPVFQTTYGSFIGQVNLSTAGRAAISATSLAAVSSPRSCWILA